MRSILAGGLLFLALTLPTGCETEGEASPSEKCEDMAAAFCDRFVACGLASSTAYCLEQSLPSYSCGDAVGVKDSYSACMDAIPSIPCDDIQVGTIPSSCMGVILLKG